MTKPLPQSSRRTLDETRILSGPFWGELRVFLAVAKAKSFNRAAEALNMSQPTVSRQVRRLQDVMGAQLVVPTQAGITLTRQGEELARSLRDLDQKLFEISTDLNAETRTAEGTVRLVISEVLAGLSVIPAMVAFSEMYPKIHLEMCAPTDHTSLRANHGDVMISVMPHQGPDVVSRPLGFLHMLPVATQDYIARYGVPTNSNLSAHCFVQCTTYMAMPQPWQSWNALVREGVVTHTTDNLLNYALMVKNGLGIGLVATTALADPVALPLELGVHIRVPLYAVAAAERVGTKAVQIVFDWMSELFGETIPWFSPDLKLDELPRETMTPLLIRLLGMPKRNP
ncbi:LysR family transcriptional regulator [Rhizomicrobium electricum]|uniref:LysR family transcriptional regulator n=1 Tax=Rhizomicrobium electricum TaxID=480070 RepID=A0ABN1EGR4_9PROT|nr:LysR family transcriptional regulator [Rhizomicrobium electricum]NIJ48610.1 DNA-binding transcriptional LysR family regulator [Rhizomicrobium electricum]